MKIEIKNVKYAAFASEETHCFEATVYINGKRSFIASNDGKGGCNYYHTVNGVSRDIIEQAENFCKNLPLIKFEKYELNQDLDVYIGELLNRHLTAKELKRLLKSKVIYQRASDKSIREIAKVKPSPEIIARVKKQQFWEDDNIVLNEITFDKALDLFMEVA